MHYFQLTLYGPALRGPVTFKESGAPFGSFSVGDFYDLRPKGPIAKIISIVHSVRVRAGEDHLFITALELGRADQPLFDHPIPWPFSGTDPVELPT